MTDWCGHEAPANLVLVWALCSGVSAPCGMDPTPRGYYILADCIFHRWLCLPRPSCPLVFPLISRWLLCCGWPCVFFPAGGARTGWWHVTSQQSLTPRFVPGVLPLGPLPGGIPWVTGQAEPPDHCQHQPAAAGQALCVGGVLSAQPNRPAEQRLSRDQRLPANPTLRLPHGGCRSRKPVGFRVVLTPW